MATTKAYELAQLGNDLTVDSAGNLEFNTTVDLQYSGFDSDFGTKSTDNLTEGTNLYYTDSRADARADARIAAASTDDLTEGTNLYYTDARADARITAASTDDLSEGSTNLYYTDARADARADARIGAADTDDLTEGSTNLYFTDARADARADARITATRADTDDLSEGSTNLYYTDARADARADARIGAADTDDLTEGSTNLYFTDARADARADARITATRADTDDLSEGSTNLYYTDARADARITAADTDDLSEGSTNLYYTDARVDTRLSGNRTFGNITTTGYIAGPASFTIDPAAVGDNTGVVVIAGDLQVDGTTTTINSSTVAIDDLKLSVATDAANSAAANGAGLVVGGANANITYTHATGSWDFDKPVNVTGNLGVTGTVDGRDIATDGTKLDGIASSANNYTHPSHPGDDASVDTGALTGATVISDLDFNITTDTLGHVTDANASVATRTLTLADLGYTGETNATADQTAAQILTAVKTVDGSGSGLDADTVDGVQASSFLRSDASDSFTGTLSGSGSISITGGVTANPGSSLVVYNSAGTAVNTVYGISSS